MGVGQLAFTLTLLAERRAEPGRRLFRA